MDPSRSCESDNRVRASAVASQGLALMLSLSGVLSLFQSPVACASPPFRLKNGRRFLILIPAYYWQLHLCRLFGSRQPRHLGRGRRRGNLPYLVHVRAVGCPDRASGGRRQGPRVPWLSKAVSGKTSAPSIDINKAGGAEEGPCGRWVPAGHRALGSGYNPERLAPGPGG